MRNDRAGQIPPPPISKAVEVADVSFFHESIFVAGRYNKLQRGISNTPWEIHGKRLAEHSVQELIAEHIDKVFMNESHKFSSAGREDADVLMLGQGRPFYLELINPKRLTVTQEDMNRLMQIINEKSQGKIEVRDLQLVSRYSLRF
jgi:tRNA pseudouridine synthase 10